MGLVVMSTRMPISAKTELEADIDDIEEGESALPETTSIDLALTEDDCGERLDKVLSRLVPQYSRSRLQQWIEAGNVTVDGQPGRTKATMLGDEKVII